MATGNTAARVARATDWGTDYATATLTILDGATALAVHTLAGFASYTGGVATANAIANVNAAETGTADSATLSDGTGTYTLTVGLTGADLNLTSLDYTFGQPSSISALAVTFPA